MLTQPQIRSLERMSRWKTSPKCLSPYSNLKFRIRSCLSCTSMVPLRMVNLPVNGRLPGQAPPTRLFSGQAQPNTSWGLPRAWGSPSHRIRWLKTFIQTMPITQLREVARYPTKKWSHRLKKTSYARRVAYEPLSLLFR